MSYCVRDTISVTTDASGNATEYSEAHNGRIVRIEYNKTNFDNGVDFTITLEKDATVGVWTESNVNADKTVHPTVLVQDNVGVDHTSRDFAWLCNERLKVVVASGGNTKTGSFDLIVEP